MQVLVREEVQHERDANGRQVLEDASLGLSEGVGCELGATVGVDEPHRRVLRLVFLGRLVQGRVVVLLEVVPAQRSDVEEFGHVVSCDSSTGNIISDQ